MLTVVKSGITSALNAGELTFSQMTSVMQNNGTLLELSEQLAIEPESHLVNVRTTLQSYDHTTSVYRLSRKSNR
jgi:hypothetical protein